MRSVAALEGYGVSESRSSSLSSSCSLGLGVGRASVFLVHRDPCLCPLSSQSLACWWHLGSLHVAVSIVSVVVVMLLVVHS